MLQYSKLMFYVVPGGKQQQDEYLQTEILLLFSKRDAAFTLKSELPPTTTHTFSLHVT